MKSILTLAVILTASITGAHASDCYTSKSATVRIVRYCAPYVVCTERVSSCREQRMAYDHCGRPVCCWVTVVTYRDVYSTGATRTYSRTFNA